MRRGGLGLVLTIAVAPRVIAQAPDAEVTLFVVVHDSTFVLRHVRVIDGTGAAPLDDQSVVVAGGRIVGVGPASSTSAPSRRQGKRWPRPGRPVTRESFPTAPAR